MWADLFKGLVSPITGLISEAIEDKDKKNEIAFKVQQLLDGASSRAAELAKAELTEKASIIRTEATGHSWLQRNWRPMMMLWFAFILGMYWFGLTPPNLSQETINQLFDLMKLGIGGYVVGRSAEKVVPGVIQALKK